MLNPGTIEGVSAPVETLDIGPAAGSNGPPRVRGPESGDPPRGSNGNGVDAIDVTVDLSANPPAESVRTPGRPSELRERNFEVHVVPEIEFVRRVCRRLSSSPGDAEDLAQEVLTSAYRAAGRFDGRYPRAWLHRIAVNAAISRSRRRTPTVVPLFDHDRPIDTAGSDEEAHGPERVILDSVVDPLLVDALDDLPDHYRTVVDLVDVTGLSYEDAAARLEIPTGTVMSRLHRGRRKLRESLAGTHLDRSRGSEPTAPV